MTAGGTSQPHVETREIQIKRSDHKTIRTVSQLSNTYRLIMTVRESLQQPRAKIPANVQLKTIRTYDHQTMTPSDHQTDRPTDRLRESDHQTGRSMDHQRHETPVRTLRTDHYTHSIGE